MYNKIDQISENLTILNNSIEDLRSTLKNTSQDVTKKISKLEDENDKLRKILIEKVMDLENTVIEDLKSTLSKITIQDNQEFINNVRKLYRELKTISWLTEISSMGKLITDLFERIKT